MFSVHGTRSILLVFILTMLMVTTGLWYGNYLESKDLYNIVGNISENKSMIGLAIDNHRITSEINRGVQLFIERDEDNSHLNSRVTNISAQVIDMADDFNIFFTMKTTPSYYDRRIRILHKTWFQKVNQSMVCLVK